MPHKPIVLSTSDLPDQNQDEIIREFYGKIAQRMEIDPAKDAPVHIHASAFR